MQTRVQGCKKGNNVQKITKTVKHICKTNDLNTFIKNSTPSLKSFTQHPRDSSYPPWSQPVPPQSWIAAGWFLSASAPDVTSWGPNTAEKSDRPETKSRCYFCSLLFHLNIWIYHFKRSDYCKNDAILSQTLNNVIKNKTVICEKRSRPKFKIKNRVKISQAFIT